MTVSPLFFVRRLKCDYVCFRGLLTKIMVTPVFNEDWVVCAINFMGNVYLCEYTEEKKDYEDQEKFLYWGRKFETYVLSGKYIYYVYCIFYN